MGIMAEERSGEGKEESRIIVLKRSRKAYIPEYFCAGALLTLTLVTYLKGIQTHYLFQYYTLGIAALAICSAEISRMFLQYRISKEKISIIKGFIQKNHKNIYFRSLSFVPDLNLKQGRIQRLLNYGTVFIESQSGKSEHSMEIREVDNPKDVLKMLEEFIEGAAWRGNKS